MRGHVGHYHSDRRIDIEQIESLPTRSRRDCGVAMMDEQSYRGFGKIKIVVDYQDLLFRSHGVWKL
jgi:hypothetical protein